MSNSTPKTTISTASKQSKQSAIRSLSVEEINAVSGGLLRALETFGKALSKAGQI